MHGNNLLKGKIIQRVQLVEGYLQIFFKDTSSLNIYNKYKLQSNSETTFNSLKDLEIKDVIVGKDELNLKLDNKITICVGMAPSDYFGPEAMYYSDGTQMIVWQTV